VLKCFSILPLWGTLRHQHTTPRAEFTAAIAIAAPFQWERSFDRCVSKLILFSHLPSVHAAVGAHRSRRPSPESCHRPRCCHADRLTPPRYRHCSRVSSTLCEVARLTPPVHLVLSSHAALHLVALLAACAPRTVIGSGARHAVPFARPSEPACAAGLGQPSQYCVVFLFSEFQFPL
jgi:hypothetical protein